MSLTNRAIRRLAHLAHSKSSSELTAWLDANYPVAKISNTLALRPDVRVCWIDNELCVRREPELYWVNFGLTAAELELLYAFSHTTDTRNARSDPDLTLETPPLDSLTKML